LKKSDAERGRKRKRRFLRRWHLSPLLRNPILLLAFIYLCTMYNKQ
jgi:hypothetical protein